MPAMTATPRPTLPGKDPQQFRGLRVGVVGLGLEGLDIVRFLHREGTAEIVVSERKPVEALRAQIRALAGIPFALQADDNNPALARRVDALFVSQGVPDDLPLLAAAREAGVPITAMMRLFLQRCPMPVVGITGSAGKTTVTALVGAMFEAAGRPVFVGGNIGRGLLEALPAIAPETAVVLEISHTQLVRTDRSPHLAAVLNVRPNHLDQFDWPSYVDLKRNLVRHQGPSDLVVLPSDEENARAFRDDTPAALRSFGLAPFEGAGATVRDDVVVWRDAEGDSPVCDVAAIRLPGAHNLQNVLAAVSIGRSSGLPLESLAAAVAGFEGVPHRLETVAEIDGVRYVDDSIATAPERTVAALRALPGPIVLLLGGREKRLPLEPLIAEALGAARAIVCFGEAGPAFAARLSDAWRSDAGAPAVLDAGDLASAVRTAQGLARAGDTVLLAPAGASFDAYDNFAARGDHFRALVRRRGKEASDGPR